MIGTHVPNPTNNNGGESHNNFVTHDMHYCSSFSGLIFFYLLQQNIFKKGNVDGVAFHFC